MLVSDFVSMALQVSQKFFLPLLLIGPCLVFYPVCLFSFDVNIQHFRGQTGLRVFGFPFFATFASRLSSILFTLSSLHLRFLILVHFIIS